MMNRLCWIFLLAAVVIAGCGKQDAPPTGTSEETNRVIDGEKHFEGGSGTASDPYLVRTIEQLRKVDSTNALRHAHYRQTADINAEKSHSWNNGTGFDPLGNILPSNDDTPFAGHYNGDGHTITNLKIVKWAQNGVGLFSVTNKEAVIENLHLRNVTIKGNTRVGGLTGINGGTLRHVSVTGTIEGERDVGGLVGSSEKGLIRDCFAKVTVKLSPADIVVGAQGGGLVGRARDTRIENCHASGTLKGKTENQSIMGGLVGLFKTGQIHQSYAKVDVSANNIIGGLVGWYGGDARISSSYAAGNVEGNEFVGGLIGIIHEQAEVKNTYARGEITGSNRVGGLVGQNEGSLKTSYSAGSVQGTTNTGGVVGENQSNLSNVYWDKNTAKQARGVGTGSSEGAKGLKTSSMSGDSAKTNLSGFDFQNTWTTTDQYPILQWQE